MVKSIISFYPGGGGNRYYLYTQGYKDFLPKKAYDDRVKNQSFKYRYIDEHSLLQDIPIILTHCINTTILKNFFPNHKLIVIKTDLKESLLREWKINGHDRYINKVLKMKNDLSILEHYNAFKDRSWPSIDNATDLANLSCEIQKEVFEDYKKNHATDQTKDLISDLKNQIGAEIESAYETISWHRRYYHRNPMDFTMADTIIDINDETNSFSVSMRKEIKNFSSDIFDRVWELATNE